VDFCLVPGISSLKLVFFWQLGAVIPSSLQEKNGFLLVIAHHLGEEFLLGLVGSRLALDEVRL
jgi:hypothetical protein